MDKRRQRSHGFGKKPYDSGDKKGDKGGGAKWTKSPYRSTNQSKKTWTGPKSGKKHAKVLLSFDEDERQTFLSGFQKRKAERKQRANEKLEEQAKEEMKRIKDKRDEKIRKLMSDNSVAKELNQHAEYSLDYDLPEQTVNIVGLDIGNISSSLGLTMGVNRPKVEEEPEESTPQQNSDKGDNSDDDQTEEPKSTENIRENLKKIKKSQNKELQKSKVLKAKQRLKTKKAAQVKKFGTKSERRAKARGAN